MEQTVKKKADVIRINYQTPKSVWYMTELYTRLFQSLVDKDQQDATYSHIGHIKSIEEFLYGVL